jgi:mannitol-1-phosphate 5-dehydrogenase
MNVNKRIVIWGAGKIGRGFIADLFFAENYQITFVDQSELLVNELNQRGHYHVILARGEKDITQNEINGYQAFTTQQVDEIQAAMNLADIVAISVFPKYYDEVAGKLLECILERKRSNEKKPLDIILCTNLMHAGPIFKESLYKKLSQDDQEYLERSIGIVESLVIRICPDPNQNSLQADPLVVLTNGYPILPVEKSAFKGNIPSMSSLRLVKDMRAEETRKIYTYNMFHAVLSYLGILKGHKLLVECLADEEVARVAIGALNEVNGALQKEYSFSPEEIKIWIDGVIEQTNNPAVGDTVLRSAADPIRKLNKDDRLIGPALLCIRNGITPNNLTSAIGAAFIFYNDNDLASKKLHELIENDGIRLTAKQICGLDKGEDDFVDEIVRSYIRVLLTFNGSTIAEKTYQLGFDFEKNYHGCGQCVLAPVLESMNLFDQEIFKTATGLSGGIGQVTDASCSAFIAGAMVMGLLFPRRRKYFNADRAGKYKCFELIQQLRGKFIQRYGSITCEKIHCRKYGRSFDLTKKDEAELFEKSGAHGDNGETEVVAHAARWVVEILTAEFKQQW